MLIDDLRGVFLFDGLSDEQLGELIAAGDEVHFVKAREVYADPVTLVVVTVVSYSHRGRVDDHQEDQTKDQPVHCDTPL